MYQSSAVGKENMGEGHTCPGPLAGWAWSWSALTSPGGLGEDHLVCDPITFSPHISS